MRVVDVGVCDQVPFLGRPERGARLGVAATAFEGEEFGAGRGVGWERVDTIIGRGN